MSDDLLQPGCKSSLVSKNITVLGKRTSIRLEPQMWSALQDIANREKCSIHDICSLVGLRKEEDASLTAAIRVFLMLYFKAATTETGHEKAGHGSFDFMRRRARINGQWSFKEPYQEDDQDEGLSVAVQKSLDSLNENSQHIKI